MFRICFLKSIHPWRRVREGGMGNLELKIEKRGSEQGSYLWADSGIGDTNSEGERRGRDQVYQQWAKDNEGETRMERYRGRGAGE